MIYPRLIAVTGIDGSGKTTICGPLVNYFALKGYKTRYIWIRSLHSLAYALAKIIEYLSGPKVIVNPNNKMIERFDGSPYASIWPLIEFISIIPLIIFKIYLPLLLGYIVISDRCTIDTVVTIATHIHDPFFIKSRISRILLATIPKGAVIIYLETDIKTMLERKPDIEYSEEEINSQMMLYEVLAKVIDAHRVITSNADVDETFKAVLNIIENV